MNLVKSCKFWSLLCVVCLLCSNNNLNAQNNIDSISIRDLITKYSSQIIEGKFNVESKFKSTNRIDTLTINGLCQFNRNFLNEDSIASFVFFENNMPTLLLYNNWLYEIWLNDSTFTKTKFIGISNSQKGFRSKFVFWNYLKSSSGLEVALVKPGKFSNNFNAISCLNETAFYDVGIAERL